MYETLQAQIEHVVGQLRVISLLDLWRLCSKDCTTDEERQSRMEQLNYHIRFLRSARPILMKVPDYRTILQLHAAKRDIDTIKTLTGANGHTIRSFLDVAAQARFTWEEAQDMTNGEIEAQLYEPKDIMLKTRSQLPFDKETRHDLGLSVSVMCAMSRIDQLETILYLDRPTMLMWLSRIRKEDGTYEDKTFDVTVLDEYNIEAAAMMLPVKRKLRLADPDHDTTVHIAVVISDPKNPAKADTAFLSRVQTIMDPFDLYVIVTRDGNVIPVSRRAQ